MLLERCTAELRGAASSSHAVGATGARRPDSRLELTIHAHRVGSGRQACTPVACCCVNAKPARPVTCAPGGLGDAGQALRPNSAPSPFTQQLQHQQQHHQVQGRYDAKVQRGSLNGLGLNGSAEPQPQPQLQPQAQPQPHPYLQPHPQPQPQAQSQPQPQPLPVPEVRVRPLRASWLTTIIGSCLTWHALRALVTQRGPQMNAVHVTAVATRLAHLHAPPSPQHQAPPPPPPPHPLQPLPPPQPRPGSSGAVGPSVPRGGASGPRGGTSAPQGDVVAPRGGASGPQWAELVLCVIALVERQADLLDARGIANTSWALAKVAAGDEGEDSQGARACASASASSHGGGGGGEGEGGEPLVGVGGEAQAAASLRAAARGAVARLLALPAAEPRPGCAWQPQHLANALWAAAALGVAPGAAWRAAALAAAERMLVAGGSPAGASFSEAGLSQLLWAVAELRWAPGRAWMAAFYAEALRQAPGLTPHSAANVLLSLARMAGAAHPAEGRAGAAADPGGGTCLSHPPSVAWLRRMLLATAPRLAAADGAALANSLWALAVLAGPGAGAGGGEAGADASAGGAEAGGACRDGGATASTSAPSSSRPRRWQGGGAVLQGGAAGEAVPHADADGANGAAAVPAAWLGGVYSALLAPRALEGCTDAQLSLVLWSLASLLPDPADGVGGAAGLLVAPPAALLAAAEAELLPRLASMPDQSFALASWGLARLQQQQQQGPEQEAQVQQPKLRRQHPRQQRPPGQQQQQPEEQRRQQMQRQRRRPGPAWMAAWLVSAERRLPSLTSRGLLYCLRAASAWGPPPADGRLEPFGSAGPLGRLWADGPWLQAVLSVVQQPQHAEERPQLLLALLGAADSCLAGALPEALVEAVAQAVLEGARGVGGAGAGGDEDSGAGVGAHGSGRRGRRRRGGVGEEASRRSAASGSSGAPSAVPGWPWSARSLLRCGSALARLGYVPAPAWRQAILGRVVALAGVSNARAAPGPLADAAETQLQAAAAPPSMGPEQGWVMEEGLSGRDVAMLLSCSDRWGATASDTTLEALLHGGGGLSYGDWDPQAAAAVCRMLALQHSATPPQQLQPQQQAAQQQQLQQQPAPPQQHGGGHREQGRALGRVLEAHASAHSDNGNGDGAVPIAPAAAAAMPWAPAPQAAVADVLLSWDAAAPPGGGGAGVGGTARLPVLQRGPGRPAPAAHAAAAQPSGTWPGASDGGGGQAAGPELLLSGGTLHSPAARFVLQMLRRACASHQHEEPLGHLSGPLAARVPSAPGVDALVPAATAGGGGGGGDGTYGSNGRSSSSSHGTRSAAGLVAADAEFRAVASPRDEPFATADATAARAAAASPPGGGPAGPWPLHRLAAVSWSAARMRLPLAPPVRRALHWELQRNLAVAAAPGSHRPYPQSPPPPPGSPPPPPSAALVLYLWSCFELGVPLGPAGPLLAALDSRPELQPGALADWQLFMLLHAMAGWRLAPPLRWSRAVPRRLVAWLRVPSPSPRLGAGLEPGPGRGGREHEGGASSADGRGGGGSEGGQAGGAGAGARLRPDAPRWVDPALLMHALRALTYLRAAAAFTAGPAAAARPTAAAAVPARSAAAGQQAGPASPAAPAPGRRAPAPYPPPSPIDDAIWAPLWPLLRSASRQQLLRLFGRPAPAWQLTRSARRPLRHGADATDAGGAPAPAPSSGSSSAAAAAGTWGLPPAAPSPRDRLAALRCAHALGVLTAAEWASLGLPALRRLAHELPPHLYPLWLSLVARLSGLVARPALEELLLSFCLVSGPRLAALRAPALHRTMRAAGRAASALRLQPSWDWSSAALRCYSRAVGQLPPAKIAQVPGVLLRLRRVPPPRWQLSYAQLVRSALPYMRRAEVVRMLLDGARLSPALGALLHEMVPEQAAAAALWLRQQQKEQGQAGLHGPRQGNTEHEQQGQGQQAEEAEEAEEAVGLPMRSATAG